MKNDYSRYVGKGNFTLFLIFVLSFLKPPSPTDSANLVVVVVEEGVGVDVVPHDLNVFVVDALSTTNMKNECDFLPGSRVTRSISVLDFIRSVCLFLLPLFLPSKDRQGHLQIRLLLQPRQSLFSGND